MEMTTCRYVRCFWPAVCSRRPWLCCKLLTPPCLPLPPPYPADCWPVWTDTQSISHQPSPQLTLISTFSSNLQENRHVKQRLKVLIVVVVVVVVVCLSVSLAIFIGAKDDGDGGDNCSYKTCKAPVKSSPSINQHPTFYRPDALPVAQPTVLKHWREKYLNVCHYH